MPAFTLVHFKEFTLLFWEKCVQLTDCMGAEIKRRPGPPLLINE